MCTRTLFTRVFPAASIVIGANTLLSMNEGKNEKPVFTQNTITYNTKMNIYSQMYYFFLPKMFN